MTPEQIEDECRRLLAGVYTPLGVDLFMEGLRGGGDDWTDGRSLRQMIERGQGRVVLEKVREFVGQMDDGVFV